MGLLMLQSPLTFTCMRTESRHCRLWTGLLGVSRLPCFLGYELSTLRCRHLSQPERVHQPLVLDDGIL